MGQQEYLCTAHIERLKTEQFFKCPMKEVELKTCEIGFTYCAVISDESPADIWPALEISHNPGHESLQSARFWRSNSCVLSAKIQTWTALW
ncbi:hypothetical protein ES288_D10G001300v1 [Gossypium darwinii]|uniref:Uncharacterized protein n=1 Tax=Gossypium darwinii TaxID=34276 RepID=A0A5D2AUW2_GOSDA|nr:hypothetical protein ES288_D10G001300v1 [Gossypium darwinii]